MKREPLYKKDRKGNMRVWWAEYGDTSYWTSSGILGGAITTTQSTVVEQKNVGKANETSLQEQVLKEVDALYVYQRHQGKYHNSPDEAENGAIFVECLLADTYNKKKHVNFPYLGQPKLDGARALGVDGDTLQTRNGKLHVSCPHINADIERFQEEYPGWILDGELYNHDLKHDFEKLMSLVRKSKNVTDEVISETRDKVFLYVYDVIPPNPMTFEERYKFLKNNVYGKYEFIRQVPTIVINDVDEADAALANFMEEGYEGLMLREGDSFYQSGRNKTLIKYKVFIDVEATLLDIEEGIGTWAGYGKVAVIRHGDVVQKAGIKGNFAFTKQLLSDKDELIGTDVTIQAQRYSSDGKLVFPIVTYWWKGKRDV